MQKKMQFLTALFVLGLFLLAPVCGYAGEKVNINEASVEELTSLNGIGPALAERIIEYRDKTPFGSIEEITEVKGIGPKTFEKLRDQITVE